MSDCFDVQHLNVECQNDMNVERQNCFDLRHSNIERQIVLGLGLLDLLSSQVCLAAQKPPEIGVEEQLEEGKCGALVVDVVWDILGANIVSMELCVDPGDSL